MIIGGSDGDYVAQPIRNHGLAAIVVVPTLVAAPGNNGSILRERQTVILCRCDGHHIAQARRDGGLAVRVQPPSHDRDPRGARARPRAPHDRGRQATSVGTLA